MIESFHRSGWKISAPNATMFAWAPVPEPFRELGSLEFSKLLLKEAQVAVSPGIGFGEYGEGFVRVALVENEQRIMQAARNIKRFLSQSSIIIEDFHKQAEKAAQASLCANEQSKDYFWQLHDKMFANQSELDVDSLVKLDVKPPVLWVHGSDDMIVGDESLFDLATLGKLNYIPGWPGIEAAAPQPMVSQTRAVLITYAAAAIGSSAEHIPSVLAINL